MQLTTPSSWTGCGDTQRETIAATIRKRMTATRRIHSKKSVRFMFLLSFLLYRSKPYAPLNYRSGLPPCHDTPKTPPIPGDLRLVAPIFVAELAFRIAFLAHDDTEMHKGQAHDYEQ
jgi:hypothetical protein